MKGRESGRELIFTRVLEEPERNLNQSGTFTASPEKYAEQFAEAGGGRKLLWAEDTVREMRNLN